MPATRDDSGPTPAPEAPAGSSPVSSPIPQELQAPQQQAPQQHHAPDVVRVLGDLQARRPDSAGVDRLTALEARADVLEVAVQVLRKPLVLRRAVAIILSVRAPRLRLRPWRGNPFGLPRSGSARRLLLDLRRLFNLRCQSQREKSR